MGLSWSWSHAPDTGYRYEYACYRGWNIEVFLDPDNMGNYGWKAYTRAILGVTEIHGISTTVLGAKRMVALAIRRVSQ